MTYLISKLFSSISLICLLIFNLSGCSILAEQTTIKTKCTESRILLTDLTKPASKQTYLLPDKTVCPQSK